MKKSAIVFVITALLAVSIAVPVLAASGYARGVPTRVQAGFSNGRVYVSGLSDEASCGSSRIAFLEGTSDPEKIQSLAIAAFLSGKRLQCYVDGCYGSNQKGVDCALMN